MNFVEARRTDFCILYHETWNPKQRSSAGAIQNMAKACFKGGESAFHLVCSIVNALEICDDSSHDKKESTLILKKNHAAEVKIVLDKFDSDQIQSELDSDDAGSENGMSTVEDISTQHISRASSPTLSAKCQQVPL